MDRTSKVWVNRYLVALHDPLIDLKSRAEIEHNLKLLAGNDPHWTAIWVSGFLSDIIRSLDPDDPWRKLTVHDGKTLHPNGNPFGSYVDTTDIVHPSVDDIRSDFGLAPLTSRLNHESAALIAVAGAGWKPTLDWVRTNFVLDTVLEQAAAEAFFRTSSTALRWSIHRRRLFMGWDDPFIPVSGIAWSERADKIITGESWDEVRHARHLMLAAVAEGTYARLIRRG